MTKSNGQNSHEACIIKCLVHLNNLKEGPIAQNIQDTLLKQLKKLENFNIKKAMAFSPTLSLGWPFGRHIPLFIVLLHHVSYKSKRLTEKIKYRLILLQINLN